MKLNVTKLEDGITKKLTAMSSRVRSPQAFLNRTIYSMYQLAQIERWRTENASEGDRWYPLNPEYKKAKLTRYADEPYGGTQMGVATGDLFKSVVGGNSFHRKVATDQSLIIYTTVPYAPYFVQNKNVPEDRPIMEFGDATKRSMQDAIRRYVMLGSLA